MNRSYYIAKSQKIKIITYQKVWTVYFVLDNLNFAVRLPKGYFFSLHFTFRFSFTFGKAVKIKELFKQKSLPTHLLFNARTIFFCCLPAKQKNCSDKAVNQLWQLKHNEHILRGQNKKVQKNFIKNHSFAQKKSPAILCRIFAQKLHALN